MTTRGALWSPNLTPGDPAATAGRMELVTLLASDLVGSTRLVEDLGDQRSSQLFALHERLARDLLAAYDAREIDKTDGFLLMFSRPTDAVRYALAYHGAVDDLSREQGVTVTSRVGIHVGEVILRAIDVADVAKGAKPVEIEGLAKPVVARIMSLALPGQTLITRVAFDIARRGVIEMNRPGDVAWLAHGPYVIDGLGDAIDVHEVGLVGSAPLRAPSDSEKAHRVVDPYIIGGWRPAADIAMPFRPNWVLRERVGVGGFGDVWRGEHTKTHEQRVYKFCYDSRALRALKREVTIVRLLKNELGDRDDIARIIDWNFEAVPYFIECEWTSAGNLDQWAASHGGLDRIPIETRVAIVQQTAFALAAAHSVGVLHKDIKPTNILVRVGVDGLPHAQLADFGIGLLTDRNLLSQSGITAAGFTDIDSTDQDSTAGTRLYLSPELVEGKMPTIQADVYALGVVLYQLVVGDLTRALGPGWERDVQDPVLREDIALAVDRSADRRIDVRSLAERLRQLDTRRHERHLAELEQERNRRNARRRRWLGLAGAAVVLVATATGIQLQRVAREAKRANQEAETARRVSAFMVELFRLADPGEARGNSVTAREILDGGARRINAELKDQPEVQSALMTSIGSVYLGLGLLNQARPLLDTALMIRRSVFGESALETAESWYAVGQYALQAGDHRAAIADYERALGIRAKRGGVDDAGAGEVYAGLGMARWNLGDTNGAIAADDSAIRLLRTANSPAMLGVALGNLGAVYLIGAHQPQRAESLYRRALEIEQRTFGSDDRRVAQMMNNLGIALATQGRFVESREMATDAVSLSRRLLGDQHPQVAMTSIALGQVLQALKRDDEAERLYRQSIATAQHLLGPDHGVTAFGMENLASLLADKGRCTEAEPMARRAAEILGRQPRPGAYGPLPAVGVLGQCAASRGDFAQAESLLVKSYDGLKDEGSLFAAPARNRLVAFYMARGDTAEARLYREALAPQGHR